MDKAAEISIVNFSLIYLLLILIGVVMKASKISHTKLLLVASIRMTAQLILAGYVLMYLLKEAPPVLIILYVVLMTAFAIHRVLAVNQGINKRFKYIIAVSISSSALVIIAFFIKIVVGESILNPQYLIPISGMIIGNAMTGVALGVKTFTAKVKDSRLQIEVLLNCGATPKKILLPMVNEALETALLPTINVMLGMGIVSLPGMMTGQILSGESPLTAIVYQISITIGISAVVCLATFLSLNFGYKTLYNKENQL